MLAHKAGSWLPAHTLTLQAVLGWPGHARHCAGQHLRCHVCQAGVSLQQGSAQLSHLSLQHTDAVVR